MKKKLTEQEFLSYVKGHTQQQGQGFLAGALGISASYMSDVLSGRRKISKVFAELFNFKKVIYFETDNYCPAKKVKTHGTKTR